MGNYRFKFSDMMPNAWFYKLRDMGKSSKNKTTTYSRKKNQSSSPSVSSKTKQSQQCNPRKSYYFTRDLTPTDRIIYTPPKNPNSPEPPGKSSSKQRRAKKKTSKCSPKLVSSSVSAGCSCRTTLESVWTKSDSPPEYSSSSPFYISPEESKFPEPQFRTDRVLPTESFDEMVFLSNNSNSCSCRRNSNADDIVIDVDNNSIVRKDDKLNGNGYDSFSELQLHPIITKPVAEFNDFVNVVKKKETKSNLQKPLKVKIVKEEQRNSSARRFSVSSPGVKLRIHSPRIASRKVHQTSGRKSTSSRRSLSDSFAIVKSSFNPQRDFRESMMEMIVENNIRNSKDLEDLLACYLSLNSDEYHALIIKVFKQIWFDLTDNTLE